MPPLGKTCCQIKSELLQLNLTRAVQLCIDIGSHILSHTNCPAPQTMGSVFTLLQEASVISSTTSQQLKKAVGFRNIAVHQYEAINWEIVYTISQHSPQDFCRFAQEISRYAGL
ncbi:type VII toxin-antitoxin system HepT family RNase toxin [Nitrosomonas europaea]|uniref:type VII toxin-antitoxin system HepT family RNase toxin n=2 Tax=Nitrosomonas TaxID=914 RepID=UPI00099950C3|nr:DUF86 domain-containing protein [Nitrosomonas europaea]